MKRLIAVDAGNTFTKYGLFQNGELTKLWRHRTSAADKTLKQILGDVKAEAVALASVVPVATNAIRAACRKNGIKLVEVKSGNQSIVLGMDPSMGADRVADVVAARHFYGKRGQGIIQMSFGSATTLLAVKPDGNECGGLIAPGLQTTLESLHWKCALLPRLQMGSPSNVLGYDTESHMRNGVFLGHVGMVREWIATARRSLGREAVTVATGGWDPTLQTHGKLFNHVDPYLTLKGVELIARKHISG